MSGLYVVLYHRCHTGSDHFLNQSMDCSVFSSTLWSQIYMTSTPTKSGTVQVSNLGTSSGFSERKRHKMHDVQRQNELNLLVETGF